MSASSNTHANGNDGNSNGGRDGANRKEQILSAALDEFTLNGYEGARMQVIADEVGVTKAMIHYYFDTKENLFRRAFEHACSQVLEGLMQPLETGGDLFAKLEQFIDEAHRRSSKHPELITLIISSLNREPEITRPLIKPYLRFDMEKLNDQLEQAAAGYEIASVKAEQLIINILSLCMLPYSSSTLLAGAVNTDLDEMRSMLDARKGIATDVVFNWLTS